MRELRFHLYLCGMSEETFTEQIMIYKPIHTITRTFSQRALEELKIDRVGDLIEWAKRDPEMCGALGEWGFETISAETVYVQREDCLLGLLNDKTLLSIFHYFHSDLIEMAYFITGGASIHNETGYRFAIYPDEEIHRYTPHVHVSKGGAEARYSLEKLQPMDPLPDPLRRDHKKIILPFLQKNQENLLRLWKLYIDGYVPPVLAQDGKQFYKES